METVDFFLFKEINSEEKFSSKNHGTAFRRIEERNNGMGSISSVL